MEILAEFFKVRLEYYEKRKDYLERMLGAESAKLDNMARFIVEKIEGKIKVENMKRDALVKLLAEKGYQSDPVRQWKERMAKERGAIFQENLEPDESSADAGSDFNYLLSMPIWNLTLEKKEEILKQQKQKNADLKLIKSKSVEQLWLDDLSEFKESLEKFEAKEKEEIEMFIKKSLKSQKGAGGKNLKNEYLPDPIGQKIEAKIDPQLLSKVEKDAQQKVLIKAKKEESLKGLNLVDIILAETKLTTEEEVQVKELASNLANPSKAKAAKAAATPKKVRKTCFGLLTNYDFNPGCYLRKRKKKRPLKTASRKRSRKKNPRPKRKKSQLTPTLKRASTS